MSRPGREPRGGRRVELIADPAAAAALRPLSQVWASEGRRVRITPWADAGRANPRGPIDLAHLAEDSDAVLVIGPRSRSPRTVLPGPAMTTSDGRIVPVAWLPATTAADIARFAAAAAAVHQRAAAPPGPRTLAVLGERQPRFDRLAGRVVALAEAEGRLRVHRATAYEVTREDCVAYLGTGPALALYVGHGRPVGWVGYAGMRASHLAEGASVPGHRPAAALVSLTCRTASRRRTGLSFAEAVVLGGTAAASVGAVVPTLHTGNARWAVRVARDLPLAPTIGDLVARLAANDAYAAAFRLVGDPTAPLLDAPAGGAETPRSLQEAS